MKWASSETVARWPSRANRAATNPNSAEPKPSPPTTPSAPPSPRTLLTHKLEGQLHVTANLPNLDEALTAHAAITAALADLEQAGTIELMRQAESQAARAYWQAWASMPLTFARRDVGQVPDSWRVFGSRTSTLSGGPRLAATPGNALLNYLYALAEQEDHPRPSSSRPRPRPRNRPQRPNRPRLARDLGRTPRPTRRTHRRNTPQRPTNTAHRNTTNHGPRRSAPPARHANRDPAPQAARELWHLWRHVANPGRAHCDTCLPEARAEQRAGFAGSGPNRTRPPTPSRTRPRTRRRRGQTTLRNNEAATT